MLRISCTIRNLDFFARGGARTCLGVATPLLIVCLGKMICYMLGNYQVIFLLLQSVLTEICTPHTWWHHIA